MFGERSPLLNSSICERMKVAQKHPVQGSSYMLPTWQGFFPDAVQPVSGATAYPAPLRAF